MALCSDEKHSVSFPLALYIVFPGWQLKGSNGWRFKKKQILNSVRRGAFLFMRVRAYLCKVKLGFLNASDYSECHMVRTACH